MRRRPLHSGFATRARIKFRAHTGANVDAEACIVKPAAPRISRLARKIAVGPKPADERTTQPFVDKCSAQELCVDDSLVFKGEFNLLAPQGPDLQDRRQISVCSKGRLPDPEFQTEFNRAASPALLLPQHGGSFINQNALRQFHGQLETVFRVDQRVSMLDLKKVIESTSYRALTNSRQKPSSLPQSTLGKSSCDAHCPERSWGQGNR